MEALLGGFPNKEIPKLHSEYGMQHTAWCMLVQQGRTTLRWQRDTQGLQGSRAQAATRASASCASRAAAGRRKGRPRFGF